MTVVMNELRQNPRCFLARFTITPCEGSCVRAHLIPRQLLFREVWKRRDFVNAGLADEGKPLLPRRRSEFMWDPRLWVWACGGPMGNGGHHGMLDFSRTIRLPWDALPPGLLRACEDYRIMWWLEREYAR